MQKESNPYLARLGANISARSRGGINARNNEATWSGKIAQESELLLLEWLGFFVLLLVLLVIITFFFNPKNVAEKKELEPV